MYHVYTLTIHSVTHQLYLNKAGIKMKLRKTLNKSTTNDRKKRNQFHYQHKFLFNFVINLNIQYELKMILDNIVIIIL